MASTLINKTTRLAVKLNDIIHDKLGRPWSFWFASATGIVKSDPVVVVRRIQNGKVAKNTSDFHPDFFPDYIFDNRKDVGKMKASEFVREVRKQHG